MKSLSQNVRCEPVGCGDKGTASLAIDAVRKLTTSYKIGNANDGSGSIRDGHHKSKSTTNY